MGLANSDPASQDLPLGFFLGLVGSPKSIPRLWITDYHLDECWSFRHHCIEIIFKPANKACINGVVKLQPFLSMLRSRDYKFCLLLKPNVRCFQVPLSANLDNICDFFSKDLRDVIDLTVFAKEEHDKFWKSRSRGSKLFGLVSLNPSE